MPPQEVSVNPFVLAFVLGMGILMFKLRRRYALIPFLLVAIFVPLGQCLVAGGLHFYMFRIMIMIGWARVIIKGEYRTWRRNSIDTATLLTVVTGCTAYVILWGTSDALVNRLGMAFNAFGIYLLIRFLVRSQKDWTVTLKALAIMIIPVAGFMLIEFFTGRNAFAVFGGVPFETEIRDGRLRCQGPFMHPILAGIFAAILLPVFISQIWLQRKQTTITILAVASAAAMTITSACSGPILAAVAGMVGLGCWFIRKYMRLVRWGIAAMILGLQMVMKAPVYALVGRVKVFNASTGDHRFYLLDAWVHRFSEWCLLGTKTTANWGYGLIDVTNMYVRVSVDGGLVSLICFIAVIVLCFRHVGLAVRSTSDTKQKKVLWAMGASIFATMVGFMDIQLFDQTITVWYLLTGVISALAIQARHYAVAPVPQQEPVTIVEETLPVEAQVEGGLARRMFAS